MNLERAYLLTTFNTFSIFLLILLFSNFSLLGQINTNSPCNIPESDSYWKTSSLGEVGFDFENLCTLLIKSKTEIEDLHSLLIIKNRSLVTEIYFEGKDKPFNRRYGLRLPFDGETSFNKNTLHDLRSVSKSITSILFGIAIDKKIIKDIHSSVFLDFPDLKFEKEDPRIPISWENLLTMSSGLDWNEWGYGFLFSHETSLLWKKDLVKFVLDRDLINLPGMKFNYNGGGTTVLAEILRQRTGKSLKVLAEEWLFKPLDIREYEWVEDRYGRDLAHAGLRLKPRDMARIGLLMLNGGVWDGKSIVSNQWVQESLKSHINTGVTFFRADGSELGYGYHWWVGESKFKDKNILWNAALGNGGQLIYIIPEQNMLVITTAGGYGSPKTIRETTAFLDKIIQTVK